MKDLVTVARSWLFAPGHSEKLLSRVFDVGADAVILDLEDAVPNDKKAVARALVADALRSHRVWVRINRPASSDAEADLAAVASLAAGLRVPKVDSADDVAWVAERAAGVPLTCTIESARGVLNAFQIARAIGVEQLAFGAADLATDLGVEPAFESLLHARSQVVLASRAARIDRPIDGAYLGPDVDGLRQACLQAKRLGFGGKSAVRPHQVPIINEVFSPDDRELDWARSVVAAFEASGGAATRLDSGELVDVPIVDRARQILGIDRR